MALEGRDEFLQRVERDFPKAVADRIRGVVVLSDAARAASFVRRLRRSAGVMFARAAPIGLAALFLPLLVVGSLVTFSAPGQRGRIVVRSSRMPLLGRFSWRAFAIVISPERESYICTLLASGRFSRRAIAKRAGVSRGTVDAIANGRPSGNDCRTTAARSSDSSMP